MPTNHTDDQKAINSLKSYLAPTLLSIIGVLVWKDVSEMKSDIKTLLTTQSANEVRINNLEREIQQLKALVYYPKTVATKNEEKIKQFAKKEDETEIN